MDGEELSSMLLGESPFQDDMLDLLFEHPQLPLQTKQEWSMGFAIDPALLTTNCPIPPIYPTFDCDPHNVADPRSVSSFLSSPEQSPPSSPGESSSFGESSPEIGPGSDLFDTLSQVQFQGSDFSTNNLLCAGFQLGTIDPSTLHPLQATAEGSLDDTAFLTPTKTEGSRKRKRSRKSADEPTIQTAVTLPRKQLLKLSSKELDDYANRLRATRPLTPIEEKDLRRQRRLIKNRESASLSRQRRKEHMDVLEEQVENLNAENEQLKARVELLSAENAALKERLQRYESPEVPQPPSLGERIRKLTKINASPFSGKSSAATAGACLAIVLFGFGLLFNAPLHTDLTNGGAFYTPQTTVVEGIVPNIPVEPEITSIAKASRGSSSKEYEFPEWRIRKPLEIDEPGSASMPIDVDNDEINFTSMPVTVAKKPSLISVRSAQPEAATTLSTTAEPEPMNTSSGEYQHPAFASVAQHQQPKASEKNTTDLYLLCPQVQPLWASEHTKQTITPMSSITLLLPADLLGGIADNSAKHKTLLQVVCRVQDVKSVCINSDPISPSLVSCSS